MSDVRDVRLKPIIEAIELYLLEHPAAADSELGISEWWLYESGVDGTVEEVAEALRLLAIKGVVEKIVIGGGHCIWRAAQV